MSVGSTTTRHWVNSVSDIYGPDEIEELLEDLQVKIIRIRLFQLYLPIVFRSYFSEA